jgi:predicted aconitase with swiveling domain
MLDKKKLCVALTFTLALAACGSDDVTPPSSSNTTPPPATPPVQQVTQLFSESIAPYTSWGTVPIVGTGFGSAMSAAPNKPGFFYGMTDRGPNVTAPDGSNKIEPYLAFQPAIALFQLVDGKANVSKVIGLALADGTPMNGRVNPEATTAEIIYDVNGNVLPTSPAGLDPEGLVAMADGTFWVSDEYGPYIVHFDATGKEISRLNPYSIATTGNNVALPGELKKRKPNKGMEGLTLTPDGKYLVGIMQSPLDKNGTAAVASAKGAITRVVKVSLADPVNDVHEYLYSLHTNGAGNPEGQAVSEITAMPDGTFIVDERDGNFEGTVDGTATGKAKADKNLWKLDLSKATDIGPKSPLIGTTIAGGVVAYDSTNGLTVGGKTIEDLAGTVDAPAAVQALSTAGVTVGTEGLFLNYAALFTSIDPKGMYFGHDKVEGVALDPADPTKVYISNDSDFGITDEPSTVPMATSSSPFPPSEKFLPDGKTQDFGEIVKVDMTQVPAKFKQ